MSGLINEVKKQIISIKKTRKITKAMQLVAASKMKSFQKRAVKIREYVLDLLYLLEQNSTDLSDNDFLKERKEGISVFILYSSDKGLCGSLNQQLFRTLFNSNLWNSLKPDEKRLVTIGKKSFDYARYNKIDVAINFTAIDEEIDTYKSLYYINQIVEAWEDKNKRLKDVYIIAPHYKNSFTFYPVIKQVLPISDLILKAHIGVHPEVFTKELGGESMGCPIFEPSEEVVADKLVHQLIKTLFMQSFVELKASEYSSRMMAMQNATDSATNIIDEKTLIYNKARQQAITQELAEIIGASNF
jgi:F-type H+-transporting ATPase subunit gamma